MYLRTSPRPVSTGLDQLFNRSWSEPVETGLETAKDRKRPVYCSSVRFVAGLQKKKTGLGLGLWPLRLKTETGPDFQSLKMMYKWRGKRCTSFEGGTGKVIYE